MRRSCVITHPVVVNDGKPFEAYNAETHYISSEILRKNEWVEVVEFFSITTTGLDSYISCLDDEKEALIKWQLAQALNPPIKVTQAVLDAMDTEMNKVIDRKNCLKFRIVFDNMWGGSFLLLRPRKQWIYKIEPYDGMVQHLQIGDHIQADCPLALQVLLDFNEEGELFDV